MKARSCAFACFRTIERLVDEHGPMYLAPLSLQDSAALQAFAHLLQLYLCISPSTAERHVLRAMREVVLAMTVGCRRFARAAIASGLEGEAAPRLWLEIVESDPSGVLQADTPTDDESQRIQRQRIAILQQRRQPITLDWNPPRYLPAPEWLLACPDYSAFNTKSPEPACVLCGRIIPNWQDGWHGEAPAGFALAGWFGHTLIVVCAGECPPAPVKS